MRLHWVSGTLKAVLVVAVLAAGLAEAFKAHSAVYPPPATGPFAYNSFVPALTPGASYVDPVFGETVRRLTTDHNHDDIYARNMWWSADERRYLHIAGGAAYWERIDVGTGNVTPTRIPYGGFSIGGGFDPADPNALYYLKGSSIHKVTLNAGGTRTDAVYWTAPGSAALKGLGGTLNWFDASARYMLVRYGPEPSVRLYDRQNLAAGPYANPIDGSLYPDSNGYLGLSPDGQFIVGYQDGVVGFGRMGQGASWKIDHTARSVSATPTFFWSLCGDHGSFISTSDDRNYMVVSNCYDRPELWRVDITNSVAGLNVAQQKALPNNQRLIAWPTWTYGCNHVSTVARGALRDWAFCSTEDGTDVFNGPVSPWSVYRQEILAVNVLTGEIRRLAHHRSRSVGSNYYSSPRVSVSWGGAVVGFASNFNQPRGVEIYAIPFAAPAPPSPRRPRRDHAQ